VPLTRDPHRDVPADFLGPVAVWEAPTTWFAVKRLDQMPGRLASLSKDDSSPGADRKDHRMTGQPAREHVNVDDLARNPRSER
jgi:hypothetical protein